MIVDSGYSRYNIWEHSAVVRELYRQRCSREAEEMTAHAQAAELLAPHVQCGDSLLDAGCGSGYFFHSLVARGIDVEYWGIDAAPSLIAIGRAIMPNYNLSEERLRLQRIEDTDGACDHAVCINVLSNIDNFHRPLERLLRMTHKTVVLRESLKEGAQYTYVEDQFLDPDMTLKVHVNHYDRDEVTAFIQHHGFDVEHVIDRRTGGQPEMVIGYPHYWTFLVATRRKA